MVNMTKLNIPYILTKFALIFLWSMINLKKKKKRETGKNLQNFKLKKILWTKKKKREIKVIQMTKTRNYQQ